MPPILNAPTKSTPSKITVTPLKIRSERFRVVEAPKIVSPCTTKRKHVQKASQKVENKKSRDDWHGWPVKMAGLRNSERGLLAVELGAGRPSLQSISMVVRTISMIRSIIEILENGNCDKKDREEDQHGSSVIRDSPNELVENEPNRCVSAFEYLIQCLRHAFPGHMAYVGTNCAHQNHQKKCMQLSTGRSWLYQK